MGFHESKDPGFFIPTGSITTTSISWDVSDFSNVDPPDFDGDTVQALRQVNILINLTAERVKFLGFSKQQEQSIYKAHFFTLFLKDCVDAFRAAHLATPAEVIRDRGLIIGNSALLNSSSNNQLLDLAHDSDRIGLLSHRQFGTDGFTSFTSTSGSGRGPVYTFFNFWDKENFSFSEAFVHERIHGSDVPDTLAWYQYIIPPLGHDLSGLSNYNSIISACSAPVSY